MPRWFKVFLIVLAAFLLMSLLMGAVFGCGGGGGSGFVTPGISP